MLNSSGESGHPCLVPDFRGNAFNFSPLRIMFVVGLMKTLESPLDCKEIKPVHPNGDQSWVFIGRTDAETPILWPADVKS